MRSRDYEEFLESLNAHEARYLVVGAHAVAFHARPRATKDLDVLIEPSEENAQRTLAAIRDFFGGSNLGLSTADLMKPDTVIQLGVAPSRIDLLASLTAIRDFQAAWEARAQGRFGDVPTQYLSLDDLLLEQGEGRAGPGSGGPAGPPPGEGPQGVTQCGSRRGNRRLGCHASGAASSARPTEFWTDESRL